MITTGNTVFDFKEDRYTQGKTKEGFPQPWPRNEESAMGKNKTHTAKLLQQFINHCSAAAKSGSNVLGIRIHNTVFKRRVTTHFRQRLTSVLLLFSQHIANLFQSPPLRDLYLCSPRDSVKIVLKSRGLVLVFTSLHSARLIQCRLFIFQSLAIVQQCNYIVSSMRKKRMFFSLRN